MELYIVVVFILVLTSSATAAPADLSPLHLGFDKRMDENSYNMGFGKRMDSNSFQVGFGKRRLFEPAQFKRVDPQSFPIGFGKRSFDYLPYIQKE
jgi:hypothetical protein